MAFNLDNFIFVCINIIFVYINIKFFIQFRISKLVLNIYNTLYELVKWEIFVIAVHRNFRPLILWFFVAKLAWRDLTLLTRIMHDEISFAYIYVQLSHQLYYRPIIFFSHRVNIYFCFLLFHPSSDDQFVFNYFVTWKYLNNCLFLIEYNLFTADIFYNFIIYNKIYLLNFYFIYKIFFH